MSNLCPTCKIEFQSRPGSGFLSCVGGCGLQKWSGDDPIWYLKHVGPYRVYWDIDSNMRSWIMLDATSTIASAVWKGGALPFDIDEYMIKLYLTFQ